MTHAPLLQAALAWSIEQATPQPPQLFTLDCVGVSQPSVALALQSA